MARFSHFVRCRHFSIRSARRLGHRRRHRGADGARPQSSGIGGGFLLHFNATSGAIESFDGRETAPASADGDLFRKADCKLMSWPEAAAGGLSVGVPGVLRMLQLVHRIHGRLPWASLFEPAI